MSDSFVKIHLEDGLVFSLNTDGTYALTSLPSDATVKVSESIMQRHSCLLQCYSNGHINKINLNDILLLRKNYTYSHGIYSNTTLQLCDVCSDNDFVMALFEKADKKCLSITSVESLTSHSMLGLKGDSAIKTTFDDIANWYIITNDLIINVSKIIDLCSRKGYVCFDNEEVSNEFFWIKENIIKSNDNNLQSTQPIPNQKSEINNDSDEFDFSTLIGIDKLDALRSKFKGYLKQGRNIPIGQSHVKDVLSLCNNKDDFWRVIKCLLECKIIVYRSPIVSYFKNNPDSLYTPDYETLKSVMSIIYSTDDKIEKNLEFLYPFRFLLTKDDLSVVRSRSKDMSQPEHYHLLGDMLNYTPKDLIDFCLSNASAASYYCIYEVLQKCYKKGDFSTVNKIIDSISGRLDNSGIEGNLIKNLIYNDFKKGKGNLRPDLIKIKSGGFAEYTRKCHSYEGKKKYKESLNTITSLVGKRVDVKFSQSYQNHYLMSYSGIRVLLPKSMATGKMSEGTMANVFIAMADKAYNTLYATQKFPVDYKRIMQTPLLNTGDIIEVTFDLNGYPVPHKCYKKVKVSIISIPKDIDYRARYQAKVVRQNNDKYHYLIKLI